MPRGYVTDGFQPKNKNKKQTFLFIAVYVNVGAWFSKPLPKGLFYTDNDQQSISSFSARRQTTDPVRLTGR